MVALLGALYYTFSSGFRSGEANLSKERANLYATEILDYAQSIKQAVQTLQINGCDETEVSFENNISSFNYANSNSPTDGSCHVFHPSGGGLTYIIPNEAWLDSSFAPTYPGNFATWWFSTAPQLEGVGTSEADLKLTLNFINTDICITINDRLGVDNPSELPPVDDSSGGIGQFSGTYGASSPDSIGDDGGHNLPGKTSFCNGTSSANQFHMALIAR
ncbi:MAG: hypothetical protein CMH31_03605 [Micavibrio sp.]|nr:hypothetical protein [Micavibrio sp.]